MNNIPRVQVLRVLLACFLTFSFLVVGIIWVFLVLNRPVEMKGGQEYLRIESGWTTQEIGNFLEDSGLINSSLLFDLMARVTSREGKLEAGAYQLSPAMTTSEIFETIAEGRRAQVRVTLPEGLTAEETVAILAEKLDLDREKLQKIAREGNFDYHFLPEEDFGGEFRTEGYLFPETYDFALTADEYEVLDQILFHFGRIYADELAERVEAFSVSGLSWEPDLHGVMTIASLIEREAQVDGERRRIAGVFYNRLRAEKLLRSDPTVEYALGGKRPRLYYRDLTVDSPYNTYLYPGLPPGPIASPGLKSIRAALDPDEHEYLYFVARGNGTHAFSETYIQHLQFKQKYQEP